MIVELFIQEALAALPATHKHHPETRVRLITVDPCKAVCAHPEFPAMIFKETEKKWTVIPYHERRELDIDAV